MKGYVSLMRSCAQGTSGEYFFATRGLTSFLKGVKANPQCVCMLLVLPCIACAPPSSPRSTLSLPVALNFSLRLHRDSILLQRSFNGVRISSPSMFVERRLIIARASSEADGKEGSEADADSSEGSEEALSVENLPLESKLQLQLEQKLRMKLAKKIRLRRKRLLRKRRMRKKGRWPPSKMKKLKNV